MIHGKLLLICTICDRLLITTTTTTTAVEAEQEPSTPAMVTTTTVLPTATPVVVWGRGRGSPCWATATRSTAWCCPATRRPSGQSQER